MKSSKPTNPPRPPAPNQKSKVKSQKTSQLRAQHSAPSAGRIILLAVSGMSPAILTETVWALAQETPPLVPDEVVVITTARGRAELERDLFTKLPEWQNRTVWETLRHSLLKEPSDPRLEFKPCRVITVNDPASGRSRALEDIRSGPESAAAAELVLDEVRRLTANDDTRVVASLAGGRKTMGALLHAAVSLLGRRQDRLTHILVSEPLENPALRPKFFFPGQPGGDHQLPQPDGTSLRVSSTKARLELADVPFAPLHYLFDKHLGRLPGGFADLVRTVSGLVEEIAAPVHVELDTKNWSPCLDGVPIELSGRDIPFFDFLCHRARNDKQPFASHKDAEEPFTTFLASWKEQHPSVNLDFAGSDWRRTPPSAEDLRKRLDSLRNRLRATGLGQLIPILFPVRGPLGFPPDRVIFS